ncbi:MAG TPA: type II toxin-antitoxin system VapC family toxin [Blastocatellia bacterium]|nr:type II toxin-antitoxin system VapC family toxin [Blastocatellia bacterium]
MTDIVVADTNIVSYIFKEDSRSALYEPHLAGNDVAISFVTLAELHRWAISSNWGATRRRKLEGYLEGFFIIHSNDALCHHWAEIVDSGKRRGHSIQPGDAWIAATAILHKVPLVTHNGKDFAGVEGLTIISEG